MTSARLPLGAETARSLSLTTGGPLHRLERRLGIDAPVLRLILASVAVTWGIAALLALADTLVRPGGASAYTLMKLGGHTRLLVGIPLLIVAEWLLEARVATATSLLVPHGLLDAARLEAWDPLVRRVVRWRDAFVPELVIVVVVVATTLAGVAGVLPEGALRWLAPTLHAEVRAAGLASPVLWWFIAFAQPMFWFLLLRWLWHWSLWALLLGGLARLQPRLQSSHPDRVGGIEFLENPLDALVAVILCVGIVLSATWADEIAATGAAAASFAPFFLVFVACVLVVGLAPYVAFAAPLFRAKREGENAYAEFARTYVDAFDAKWIGVRGSQPLGTADLQSLADLDSAFSVIGEMRISVVSLRRATRLVVFAVGPLVPLILLQIPAADLARRLIELLL